MRPLWKAGLAGTLALVVVIGLVVVLGGSSDGGSDASSAATTGSADACTPETLSVGVANFGTNSALPWENQANDRSLWDSVYDTLVTVDPETLEPKPALAESWDVEPNRITFKLRERVQWHQGHGEFTSADVKYTMDRIQAKGMTGSATASLAAIGLSIKVATPDKYTAVMTATKPNWAMLSFFDDYQPGVVRMLSKKYVEEVGEDEARFAPVGTGPYEFVSGTPDSEVSLHAVDGRHWSGIVPGFCDVVVKRIPDPATALSSLKAGEIDITQVSGDYLQQAQSQNVRIVDNPPGSPMWVAYSELNALPEHKDYCPECPWVGKDDPASQENAKKVREALALAVDKDAITQQLFHGFANLDPFGYFLPPKSESLESSWTPPDYDSEKAKQLLAEAGYPNGFPITITAHTQYAWVPAVTQAIGQYWKEVGLRARVVSAEYSNFTIKTRARDARSAWIYSPPAPIVEATTFPLRSNALNGFLAAKTWLDKAIDDYYAEFDEETRVGLRREMGQRMYDETYGLMLGSYLPTFAVSERVGDWQLTFSDPLLHDYELVKPAEASD